MITQLNFISLSDCAREFGITRDRICSISKSGRLTRHYWDSKKHFVIVKDNKYNELREYYIKKHQKIAENNRKSNLGIG